MIAEVKQLSELTNEQLLKLFQIALGAYPDNYYIKNVQRWSSLEIMITLGYIKYLFGIVECQSDVRLGKGYSFYMKEYLSKDVLSVSDTGIKEKQEHYTKEEFVFVNNQSLLFAELLNMGF